MASGRSRADGCTAILGRPCDDSNTGAAWVFVRKDGVWCQQGSKLVAPDGANAQQGYSVALSADGNTALIGGQMDNGAIGAAWLWTRTNGLWTLQSKLTANGTPSRAFFGMSVALSADGSLAVVGGPQDANNTGAVWVFARS
jgi:hypothetical protein